MKQAIAILGASEYQNALIRKAKDMGFETHVFAWQTGDVGETAADCFYPVSIIDQEEIARICEGIHPVAFVSAASNGAACNAAMLAARFAQAANGEMTAQLTTNKLAMREALQNAGLPQPHFFAVSAAVPLEKLRDLRYPLLVKPCDRSNARGMTLVNTSAELMRAISSARERSYICNAIVEEWIDGDEYACEAIAFKGKHDIITYTALKTTGAPLFQISEAVQPACLAEDLRARLDAMMLRVLTLFQIQYGAAHIRFIVGKTGEIFVLDVKACAASDHIGAELVRISTGHDYLKMVIDTACGKAPDLSPLHEGKPARLRFIRSDSDASGYLETLTSSRNAILFSNMTEFSDPHDYQNNHFCYIVLERGETRSADKRQTLAERIEAAPKGDAHLFFMGQAGFVIKSGKGTTLAVDLYLSDCVERHDGFKRLMPKLFQPDELAFDYVLSTHWHYDHFDIDSMPLMLRHGKTRLLLSKDCEAEAEKLSLDRRRIVYMERGGVYDAGDIGVTCVFCDHGDSAPDALGLVIEVDGRRIYIAGDTALRLDRAAEIKEYGPMDVMIAPINGAFGNLNEGEAVALAAFMAPKLMIPCHYWCFAEQHGDPGLFVNLLRERLPGQKYRLMAPGESMILT